MKSNTGVQGHRPKANLGVVTLSLMNVAAVLSIVNFPTLAEYGYQIVFYILASAVCFFIPTALVSAELASAYPENGGLYLWGREAFGPQAGFVTVSMQWLNSLPWYGTALTFISTTLAYMFDPALADNRLFVYLTIVATIWICTLVNCRGIKLYAFLSSAGVTLGTIIPTILIILGAVWYLLKGDAPAIPCSVRAFLPEFSNWTDWMLLAGMMVALAGIDMTALHVTDVKNPQKNYPRAILISSVVIISASILGALAIALVVPPVKLSMASGAAQAFDQMFQALGIGWVTPPICFLLILGAITTVFTWILGPSKGLLEVAEEGYMPTYWSKRNSCGIPVRILVAQATIVSVISSVVFFMPNISDAFWVMMALSAQMYMTMYLMMFSSAFYLRIRKPHLPRPYKIPGGTPGMFLVCGLGFLTAFSAMIFGFIPPSGIRSEGMEKIIQYIVFLGFGTGIFISIPLLVAHYEIKKRRRSAMLSSNGKTGTILLLTLCGFLWSLDARAEPCGKFQLFELKKESPIPKFYPGKVEYAKTMTVAFETAGRLAFVAEYGQVLKGTIRDEAGKVVRYGGLLAQQDSVIQEADVRIAEAKLQQAETTFKERLENYKREQILVRRGVISERTFLETTTAYETAQLDWNMAKVNLEQKRRTLDGCFIYAPFPCMVKEVYQPYGTVVDVSQKVLQITELEIMRISVSLPEVITHQLDLTDQLLVYPLGSGKPVVGWFGLKDIRTGSLDCYVRNPSVPAVELSAEQKKMPQFHTLSFVFPPQSSTEGLAPLWIAPHTVHADEKGFFVWRLKGVKALEPRRKLLREQVLEKLRIDPGNLLFSQGFFRLRGVESPDSASKLEPFDILASEVSENARDGAKAVYVGKRPLFQAGETVNVLCFSHFSKDVYTIPRRALVYDPGSGNLQVALPEKDKLRFLPVKPLSFQKKDLFISVLSPELKSGMQILIPPEGLEEPPTFDLMKRIGLEEQDTSGD